MVGRPGCINLAANFHQYETVDAAVSGARRVTVDLSVCLPTSVLASFRIRQSKSTNDVTSERTDYSRVQEAQEPRGEANVVHAFREGFPCVQSFGHAYLP